MVEALPVNSLLGVHRIDSSSSVKLPFHCLSSNTTAGYGGNSSVHYINHLIVLKVPLNYTPGPDGVIPLKERIQEAQENVAEEKKWYILLDEAPHPHRLQSFMSTVEGIWLPRMRTDMKHLIVDEAQRPIDRKSKYRWMKELASAATSLECLRVAHCHIRPSNVFIDDSNHVKLGDFDIMSRYGEIPIIPTAPHWVWYDKCTGPRHDIFSMGNTIWELFTGREYEWGTPEKPCFIPHEADMELGDVILKCWKSEYLKVSALENDLRRRYFNVCYGAVGSIFWKMPYLEKLYGATEARTMNKIELARGQASIEEFLIDQTMQLKETSNTKT